MSDVCGRRRLVKLAFVTGASGHLRGFLEEPEDYNGPSDFRLADPFAFHAAFLEVPSGVNDASTPVDAFSGFLQAGTGDIESEKKLKGLFAWKKLEGLFVWQSNRSVEEKTSLLEELSSDLSRALEEEQAELKERRGLKNAEEEQAELDKEQAELKERGAVLASWKESSSPILQGLKKLNDEKKGQDLLALNKKQQEWNKLKTKWVSSGLKELNAAAKGASIVQAKQKELQAKLGEQEKKLGQELATLGQELEKEDAKLQEKLQKFGKDSFPEKQRQRRLQAKLGQKQQAALARQREGLEWRMAVLTKMENAWAKTRESGAESIVQAKWTKQEQQKWWEEQQEEQKKELQKLQAKLARRQAKLKKKARRWAFKRFFKKDKRQEGENEKNVSALEQQQKKELEWRKGVLTGMNQGELESLWMNQDQDSWLWRELARADKEFLRGLSKDLEELNRTL